jgi:hypothetical protein
LKGIVEIIGMILLGLLVACTLNSVAMALNLAPKVAPYDLKAGVSEIAPAPC